MDRDTINIVVKILWTEYAGACFVLIANTLLNRPASSVMHTSLFFWPNN